MSKFIDLTGQRFGRLTVLNRTENNGKNVQWNCVCDCGNHIVVPTIRLRQGKTRSCGCLQKEEASKRMSEQLIGKTFGLLTVIDRVGVDKWNSVIWQCRCECGDYTKVTTKDLKGKHTVSCGCHRRKMTGERSQKDLSGMQFGELVAEKLVSGRSNGKRMWLCRCSCGNTKIANTSALMYGNVKSCGCMKSVGEKIIETFLRQHNVCYVREKTWKYCRSKKPLPFDFWLPDYGMCIEFDGEQHFRNRKFKGSGETFQYRQKKDAIKTKYCEENDIILLRIPYWEKDNIESILSDWLFLNTGE